MPSRSQAQHEFMNTVQEYKRTGRMPAGLDATRQKQIRQASYSLTDDQLDDFTETRSAKLPDHVR